MITIKKIKEIEKELTSSNKLKLLNKWHPIDHMIDCYSFKNEKGGEQEPVISSRFLFLSFFVCVCVCVFLFLFCLLKKKKKK